MLFRHYLILFLAGLVLSGLAAFWFPEYQKFYVKDNRVVENTGALLYMFAGLLSLGAAFLWRTKRYVPLFFAIVSFVCALDEISWGRDDLKFEPVKLMGVKIDALHDLSDVFIKLFTEYGTTIGLWLSFLGIGAALGWLLWQNRSLLPPLFAHERSIFFGLLVLFFVLSSANDLLHLDIAKEAKLRLSVFEEYLELSAALALFFIAISLFLEGRALGKGESKESTSPAP